MKKKKLDLKDLKVDSFITEAKDNVKGGCPVYTDTVQPCTLVAQGCGGPVTIFGRGCGSALASACGNLACY